MLTRCRVILLLALVAWWLPKLVSRRLSLRGGRLAGPVALFAEGIDAWPVVAVAIALIALCLELARLAWRKSPETEWFVFWLLCAALLWAGSPWLLAVSGI